MSVQRLLTGLRGRLSSEAAPRDWLSVLLPSNGNVLVDDVIESMSRKPFF